MTRPLRPLRHPRTLNEAFGPYADRTPLHEPVDTVGHPAVTVICTVLAVLSFLFIISGGLS